MRAARRIRDFREQDNLRRLALRRRPALPEQSVQVLQADERQRWGGLPLDQQLPDHQQGVPEEALQPASLLFSQCGRQEDGDVHHEEDGGTGGRVETRVGKGAVMRCGEV